MRIKTWVIIVLNSLVIFVVGVLAFAFYEQFLQSLNERALQQLNSIMHLKRIQVERLIMQERLDLTGQKSRFMEQVPFALPDSVLNRTGVYDLTRFNPTGYLTIGLVQADSANPRIALIDHQKIQHILLERTGMGNTGESYLVGEDFRLRTSSRFFPEKRPHSLLAKTRGVTEALNGKSGYGIFPDYREVQVFSSYAPIQIDSLQLVILSEMDVSEVIAPLHAMRRRLLTISLGMIALVIVISLFLANILTRPLILMIKHLQAMANGDYRQPISPPRYLGEIQETYTALSELQQVLSGAVDFSTEIGNMNLTRAYQPLSTHDLLGNSLISMRDKLLEYQQKEADHTLTTKRLLVDRMEQERKRLARELHDGIGPLLTSLRLYVQNHITDDSHQADMKRLLDETIKEIRMMTYALMPPSLQDFGVGLTLKQFATQMQKATQLDIQFEDLTQGDGSRIPLSLGVNIFRIYQELVNNTVRHAEASLVRSSLSEFEDRVSLFYVDNGKGFSPEKTTFGAGLSNIKERVAIFNGLIEIHSEPGRTSFEIELPLAPVHQ